MFLNFNQLRSFYTAAKLKSVTSASHELMVTPAAISLQVRRFEQSLGLRLMFRHGNSIELTDVGKTIFKRCDKVFKKLEDMESFLEEISGAKSGVLRIGCPQFPAKYFMPSIISNFRKIYPVIKIILDQGTNSEMIASILNHKNDLAFIRSRPGDKRLRVKSLGSEEIVLIASPKSQNIRNDKISVMELSSIPLVLRKQGSATRAAVDEYLKRFKITPTILLESESIDLIKSLVIQDNGVSFLMKSTVAEELKNKIIKTVDILEGTPTVEYGIGYVKSQSLSHEALGFLRLLDNVQNVTFSKG